jgi:hypothetical protein
VRTDLKLILFADLFIFIFIFKGDYVLNAKLAFSIKINICLCSIG